MEEINYVGEQCPVHRDEHRMRKQQTYLNKPRNKKQQKDAQELLKDPKKVVQSVLWYVQAYLG